MTHDIYEPYPPDVDLSTLPKIVVTNDHGEQEIHYPIRFNMVKPSDETGQQRDQTGEAAEHMRYAASLKLPELKLRPMPRMGRAIVVGGAPSVANHLDHIRELASQPDNRLFALNWSHTWLLKQGIVPHACVFFEIDAEPESILKAAHPDVTYYLCSHCHPATFKGLEGFKRVLWHSPPNSDAERVIAEEIFPDATEVGGGIGTFLRTISVAMTDGYRNIEMFGCDASFPDDSPSTHVKGYETANNVETDAFFIYVKDPEGGVRRFRTVGYLALQVQEFKFYCQTNHQHFALRVHGDGLLPYVHRIEYPMQYE